MSPALVRLGCIVACCLAVVSAPALAQDTYSEAPAGGSVYPDEAPASPKKAWGEFPVIVTEDHGGHPWWADALLWLPNRLLDLIDVFRVDVGVGPSAGAVVRITEYGQLGYRQMYPASVRVGDFGRQFPAIIETSNELGAGPAFIRSKDRDVCPGEIGLGADLFIAGAYVGFCVDELFDFATGVFFVDPKNDDM